MEVLAIGGNEVSVYRVYQGSSAERGGLTPGDLILKFNGKRVSDLIRFAHLVSTSTPERIASLMIARRGRIMTRSVMIGEGEMETATIPQNAAQPYSPAQAAPARAQQRAPWNGMQAPAIEPGRAPPSVIKEFGMEVVVARAAGVRVTGIMGNSHAQAAGLRAGDIIIKCGRTSIRDLKHFQQLVSQATPEADVKLKILRSGRAKSVSMMVGEGEMEGVTPIQRR